MTSAELQSRLQSVEERIDRACCASGRGRGEVRLLAVSKFHPASAVAALASLGQQWFGENYVQEALAKRGEVERLAPGLKPGWDMIGHIQSRKASLVAGEFGLIHTLDSLKLGLALERRLADKNIVQPVLIEVNIGEEGQKSGILPDELPKLAEQALEQMPHLRLRGLMCMPPVFDAGEAARPYFARLRQLGENLAIRLGMELPHLSMGMSGDFEAAIKEGATIVRVGSAIFGPRQPRAA